MLYRFNQIAFNSTAKKKPTEEDKEHYIGLEHLDSDCLSVTRWGAEVAPIGEKLLMKKGDILFGKRRAYQRKVGIAPFDGIFSAHGMVLRPNKDIINKDFFPFFICSDQFMERAVRISVGGLSPTINWKDLREQEFDLPPLSEQRILAEKLWSAYRLKESYKRLLAATDEMVKSQFIEMFGELNTTPVGNYIMDSFPGEWGKEDKGGTGIKVIRTTNFTNSGKLNLSEVVTRSIEERKVQKKQIQKYDTILEKSGGTADKPVGRVVLFEEDEQYLCNNFTQVLRFKDINPQFAFYALFYFYQTNKTAIRSMGSKTTGIQNLNMSKYLDIGIPDADKIEQRLFVSIAEQADKSKFVGFKSQFIEMFGDCQQLENLSSLCDTFIDGDWIESKDQSNEGIRLIQTGNVGNGFFKDKEDQCRFISNETFDKLHCTEIFPGDILVARLPDPIGRSCIIPDGLGRMITAVDCSIIRLKASILPYFFVAYTMTSTYSGQINEVTTGTTRRRVSRANLGNIKVPTPPTDQQKLFVSIAEQADKSKLI